MNSLVESTVKEIEAGMNVLHFRTYVRRPFVVSLIRSHANNNVLGVGVCCVQLPDRWDKDQGEHMSKVRAVKDMLGIQNPHLTNVIAHEKKRAISA